MPKLTKGPLIPVVLLAATIAALFLTTHAYAQSLNSSSSMRHDNASMDQATGAAKSIAPTAVVGSVTGPALVKQLREGGLILWMHHGARDDREGDVSDAQAAAHHCDQQSRLSKKGREQTRAVGAGLRALTIPIAAVRAARLCRTEKTAQLLNVGAVNTDKRLDEASAWQDRGGDAAYQQAVFTLLNTAPPQGQNVVYVTSKLTVPEPQPAVLAALGPAEVAVFRPYPGGQPQLIARIGRKAWPSLVSQASTQQR